MNWIFVKALYRRLSLIVILTAIALLLHYGIAPIVAKIFTVVVAVVYLISLINFPKFDSWLDGK